MELDKQVSGPEDAGLGQWAVGLWLDHHSGVPPYQQIVRQVEDAVRLGELREGDQLPKVREVVAELAINPNTVLKAYRELVIKGLAVGRQGQGTFITRSAPVLPLNTLQVLRDGLQAWVDQAREVGLDQASMTALFARTLNRGLTATGDERAGAS